MVITAKFASTCPCCNNRIEIGSKVEWEKGAKAKHVSCPTVSPARVQATAPIARYGRRVYGCKSGGDCGDPTCKGECGW